MTFDESDITSNLPVDDDSYEKGVEKVSTSISEALDASGAAQLSPFGAVAVMACIFGRNLNHLHRQGPEDHDTSLNGNFWRRHRSLDNILLNISIGLPDHLRLPAGLADPNIVFVNMCIHASTICLHQAAIFKVDTSKLPSSVSAESKIRCINAASEIASIMRMISYKEINLVS